MQYRIRVLPNGSFTQEVKSSYDATFHQPFWTPDSIPPAACGAHCIVSLQLLLLRIPCIYWIALFIDFYCICKIYKIRCEIMKSDVDHMMIGWPRDAWYDSD